MSYVNICNDGNCYHTGITDIVPPTNGTVKFKLSKKDASGNYLVYTDLIEGVAYTPGNIKCVDSSGNAQSVFVKYVYNYGVLPVGDYLIEASSYNNIGIDQYTNWQFSVTCAVPTGTTSSTSSTTNAQAGGVFVQPIIDDNCFLSIFTNSNAACEVRLVNQNGSVIGGTLSNWVAMTAYTGNQAQVPGETYVYNYGNINLLLTPGSQYLAQVRKTASPAQVYGFYFVAQCSGNITSTTVGSSTNTTPAPATTQPTSRVSITITGDGTIKAYSNLAGVTEFRLFGAVGNDLGCADGNWTSGVADTTTGNGVTYSKSFTNLNTNGCLTQGANYLVQSRLASAPGSVYSSPFVASPNQTTQMITTTSAPVTTSSTSTTLPQVGCPTMLSFSRVGQVLTISSNSANTTVSAVGVANNVALPFNFTIPADRFNNNTPTNYDFIAFKAGCPNLTQRYVLVANQAINSPDPGTTNPGTTSTSSSTTSTTTVGGQTTSSTTVAQSNGVNAANDTINGTVVGVPTAVNVATNDSICTSGTTGFVIESQSGCTVSAINAATGMFRVTPTTGVWSFNYYITCNSIKSSRSATVAGIATGGSDTSSTTFNQTVTNPGNTTIPSVQSNTSLAGVGSLISRCFNSAMNVVATFRNDSSSIIAVGTSFPFSFNNMPTGEILSDAGVVINNVLTTNKAILPGQTLVISSTFAYNCKGRLDDMSICVQL